MEDTTTRWTFRDLFLSLGIAFDPVLLGIAYVGLLTGGALYGFFYFLGSATGEPGARDTFAVLGGTVFVVVWILTSGILARVVAVRLLEGRKAAPKEVWRYFLGRARTLLLIPACFSAIVLGALLGLGLLEVLGQMPGLGPILFGASFTLAFLLGLAAVLAFFLHTLAGFLYPSMLAVRPEGVLAVVGEILRLARQKGVHLLAYSVVILAAGAAATGLLVLVVSLALALVTSSAQAVMGEKFDWILAGLPSIFQPFLDLFPTLGPVPADVEVGWHYDLGGFLVGLSLLSIFAATAAYPFVMVHSAGTIAYFILTDHPLPTRLPATGVLDEEEWGRRPEPPEGGAS